MTAVAAEPRQRSGLPPFIRRFGALRTLALLIGVVAFVYLWIQADGRFAEATVWQVPLVIELLLLSLPWRTISARTALRFFLIGFGPVFLLTVWTQQLLIISPLHDWVMHLSLDMFSANIGSLGNVHSTVWAPITEEVGKVAPLLLLLWWGRSHLRTQGGPLDFAILAGATGAGLGFAEDLFVSGGFGWTTPESPLLGLGVGTLYLALVVNPLNVFPLPVVDGNLSYAGIVGIFNPSVEQLQLGSVWAGHGVLPALVGLAIGFAVLARRRGWTRLVWIVPVLALLWATWDHFVGNWYSSTTCSRPDAPTLCGLAQIDLVGGLLPLVAIVGFGLAMYVSLRIVRRHESVDPALRLARGQLSLGAYRGTGPAWPIHYLRDLLAYLVLRNRSAFGWVHLKSARPDARAALADPLVATRLRGAILAARLRNEPVPELPAGSRAAVERLVSRI